MPKFIVCDILKTSILIRSCTGLPCPQMSKPAPFCVTLNKWQLILWNIGHHGVKLTIPYM